LGKNIARNITRITPEFTEFFEKKVRSMCKKKRYKHIRSTARFSVKLSALFNENPSKAYFAGIAHDMARDLSEKTILKRAKEDGADIRYFEQESPVLLHGRAAAALLKQDFGITDYDILEAVRYHTYGNPGMGRLASILFIADFLEPERKHITDGYRKRLLKYDIDTIVRMVLENTFNYLNKKGAPIAPESWQLYKEKLKRDSKEG